MPKVSAKALCSHQALCRSRRTRPRGAVVSSARSSALWSAGGIVDQSADALEREVDLGHGRSEREAEVAAEARVAAAAALAGIDVEEVAGHRDDLAIERGAEERHAVADRRRQVLGAGPDVEGALGRQVDLE